MGLLRKAYAAAFRADKGPTDDFWYQPLGMVSASGMPVTAETAMKLSAVWRCVAILSGSVAMLPLPIYAKRADGGKEIQRRHPLYDVLHDRPNRWQTSYEWREMMQQHVLLRGNAYSEIVPGPRGFVDQLIPLHPDSVTPEQQPDTTIRYKVRRPNGQVDVLHEDEVFHLRSLSDDGVCGLAVLDCARESLGLSLAQEQYGARFFSQSSTPPGVLLSPKGKLTDEVRKHLSESWMAATAGPHNAHRWPVLEDGFDLKQLSVGLTADQAQLIEAREFTITDIARWFGVPPHMIGETTKETSWGSGIEQMSIGYVTYTLLPWLKRWEQRIAHSLILDTRRYFCEFSVDALLRGTTRERYEAYQIAAGGNAPWMSRNEIRQLENLNPLPDLDEMLTPLNMGGAAEQPPAGAASPGEPAPAPAGDEPDEREATARELAAWLAEHRNGALTGGH